ncbi:NACHT domain-containing protein, partial [Winogradskyella sp.]
PLISVIGNESNHLAILGQPGAGKTTSMKYICQSIFFDEEFYNGKFKYPILIKLREFNHPLKSKDDAGIIVEYLFHTLGLKIKNIKAEPIPAAQLNRAKKNLVYDILEKSKVLLIIDGFDELSFKSHKEIVREEIGEMANYLEEAKIILTSRNADYDYANESIAIYEICPLIESQVEDFANKWLGVDSAPNFVKEVRKSPYHDTAIRPLTIAHLCAIYERIGKIPDKPKTVYKKIINLLLEEWDEQRGIKRTSKYAMFEVDRKFEFLSNLAFNLTIQNSKAIFSRSDLKSIYRKIYIDFDLDLTDSKSVITDIESHTGLFVRAGYDYYEFAHKSIQEFLTADYIVKLPNIPMQKRIIEKLPNELAIAIAISSNPSEYFLQIVRKILLPMEDSYIFIQKFINRLILEKPDFYKNSKIGFSAILLYSKYMQQNVDSKNQLTLFNSDFLVQEFEDLINSVFKRNSNKIITDKYVVTDTIETIHQTKVLVMEKKNDSITPVFRNFELQGQSLPKLLYVRESFVNKGIK